MRKPAAEVRFEQTTQTDLMIMEMDCHDIFQLEDQDQTTTDKCTKKSNLNGVEMGTGTESTIPWTSTIDMDIQLMNIVAATPTMQLSHAVGAPEIDLVYVMENPLPPSPPPSADISVDEQTCLQALGPFEVLHEIVGTLPSTPTPSPLAGPGVGVAAPLQPPRYETRRVAMQRQLRQAENQNAKDSNWQEAEAEPETVTGAADAEQFSPENVSEVTPPATPPTPGPPTSPTSSIGSNVDFQARTRRELERNREFVGSLLAAYERMEKLWNPRHPDYKYNAKRSVYGGLGSQVQISNDSTESEKSCETDGESCSKSALYREVLSFILDAFKRLECLWNPQHYEYASCCKKELYREISAQLQEELNYELSGEESHKEILKLRTRYRKELRMVIKHKGLYLPKLWCYDEMEFLHPILQEQIFSKISKKVGVVEANQKTKFIDASPIEFGRAEDQLQFVEIYRNYAALWDVDHPDFRSNAYRSQPLAQMLDELNITFHTAYAAEQLEKTLFDLRKEFSAQKRKILTNPGDSCSIPLLHARLADFLEQNLGPFRCDVCSELIKTCDQYKVHRSGHDSTPPFICTLCGKGFQMPCNLTVHIRRHRRDFPYACEKCDKRFATSTEVAIHLRTHTGERPYICDLCGKYFKTWSFFDIHRRRHLNLSTFSCPICAKGFYEKNRFTDHLNSHWAIRKHLCTVCGKTFTTYGNLKKHTELHLAVKKYKCCSCGKRFAQFARTKSASQKAGTRLWAIGGEVDLASTPVPHVIYKAIVES
ncbi:zinc finger protein 615 [Drosophila miranda]|uniref:zinc finger protein 615 n=1 Tax=Drosophila miranda TaxID=7229 RepID=UPI00143F72C5|nr:zinc finger protein 615 [Drosophila miranda]